MWYAWFTLACVVLAAFGLTERRRVWSVIACASLASIVMGMFLDDVDSRWKLLAYATLEVVTVGYLLNCKARFLALWQSAGCAIAWSCHVLLFIDLEANASVIYNHYDAALLFVAALQLIPAADELTAIYRGIASGRSLRGFSRLAGMAISSHGKASNPEHTEVKKA